MSDMPRPRPPYLLCERNRHGTVVWYVRIGKGPRIRLRAAWGSPEFMAEYQAAVGGQTVQKAKGPRSGSLAWLVDRYRETAAWSALAPATRRKYGLILQKMVAGGRGEVSAEGVERPHIVGGIDKRAATPFQAANFLKAVRGLFGWALAAGHITEDPTVGVRAPRVKTTGFHAWTEAEIDKFEARWPPGTRERLAMALFLYSGLRLGDVASLGRQHIKDGRIIIRTEKTETRLELPILPELQLVIEASKTGELFLVASEKTGRGMSKEGLGNWFSAACRAAGVPGSAHGLRKAGARRAAENGATQAQLKAIYGWSSDAVAAVYIRDADRARLAREGMATLSKTGTSIPAPRGRDARTKGNSQ